MRLQNRKKGRKALSTNLRYVGVVCELRVCNESRIVAELIMGTEVERDGTDEKIVPKCCLRMV